MALAIVDMYGAPKYGSIGRPPAGLVLHTPEYGPDPSLVHAVACAKWQGSAGNTSGGSYHGLLGHDSVTFPDDMASCVNSNHWVMVRSVPWDQAAGGLSGDHGVWHWRPDRYPEIEAGVSADAFRDPNKWFHQISLGGRAGWYVANGYPKGMLICLAQWVKTLEDAYGYDSRITTHSMWQSDRSDPGPLSIIELILAEYGQLYLVPPVPVVPPPAPVFTSFSDVPASYWAFSDIEWAKGKGITSGYPDGTFKPDAPATRAEIMVFLRRLSND